MKRVCLPILLAVLLSIGITGLAVASPGHAPVGGCPDGFQLHAMADMQGDPGAADHRHIGNLADQNGDGFLCMKHVGADGTNHVHIDNTIPCAPAPARCIVQPMP